MSKIFDAAHYDTRLCKGHAGLSAANMARRRRAVRIGLCLAGAALICRVEDTAAQVVTQAPTASPHAKSKATECSISAQLTPQERALIDMKPDSWLEARDTRFREFCKDTPQTEAVSGCAVLLEGAYSGGALDTKRQKMLIWGGGHNAYYGNEVYGFDIPSSRWEKLSETSEPVPCRGSTGIADPGPDGRPTSRHTYDGLIYHPKLDALFAVGGAMICLGTQTWLTWTFDLQSRKWRNMAPKPELERNGFGSYNFTSAYDTRRDLVLLRNIAGVFTFDAATNAWTLRDNFGQGADWMVESGMGYRRARGVFLPARGVFLTLGGGRQVAFDTKTNRRITSEWQTTGGDAIINWYAPGADYDPTTDSVIAWAGGTPYELNLNTRAWQKLKAPAPVTPVKEDGIFGRWRYVPKYNVFVAVANSSQNVAFYKRTAGCGD